MKTLLLSLALISSAAFAGEPSITKDTASVAACTVVGTVHSYPPYFLPNADLRDIKKQATALGADTILLTSRNVTTSGVAYRCAK